MIFLCWFQCDLKKYRFFFSNNNDMNYRQKMHFQDFLSLSVCWTIQPRGTRTKIHQLMNLALGYKCMQYISNIMSETTDKLQFKSHFFNFIFFVTQWWLENPKPTPLSCLNTHLKYMMYKERGQLKPRMTINTYLRLNGHLRGWITTQVK